MKRLLIKILLAIITGVIFTFSTIFRREVAEVNSDQALVLRLSRDLKKAGTAALNEIKSNYVLVNTYNTDTVSKNNLITNRQQLATLLRILNKNASAYKYVVLDVLLDKRSSDSANDDSLIRYIDYLQEKKKILFSGLWDEKAGGFESQFNAPEKANEGDVTYESIDDKFFQYKLSRHDTTVKSLPFLMFLKNKGSTATGYWGGIIRTGDSLGRSAYYFNTFTPELFFDRQDFRLLAEHNSDKESVDGSTVYCNLSSIVSNSENSHYENPDNDSISRLAELLSYKQLKDKVIFIGDFSSSINDSHLTTEGEMKGPEILINVVYNISHGNGKLSVMFFLFLLIGYSLLAFSIYNPLKVELPDSRSKMFRLLLIILDIVVIEHLSYFILLFISIVAYLAYNHIVNVLTLTFFVFLLSSVMKVLKKLHVYR